MKKIEKELEIIGIKPLGEITTTEKQIIVQNVIEQLITLSNIELNFEQIYERLLSTKMYRAHLENNIGKVNYFYKEKTIYFEENMNLEEIEENIIHECLHCIQDQRGEHEELQRMGLCIFEEYKVRGMALNEIGIKYLINKILKRNDKTKIITLLKLMIIITGEDIFIDSLINNNDKFEEKFMEQTNTEFLYYKIQQGMDAIFDLEQEMNKLINIGKEVVNPEIYLNKLNTNKRTINQIFFELQWEIYTKYFGRKIQLIDQLEEIEKYKSELFCFNTWLEIGEEELKYTEFATEQLKQLNQVRQKIEKRKEHTSLIPVGQGPLYKLMKLIRKIFFRPSEYETNK